MIGFHDAYDRPTGIAWLFLRLVENLWLITLMVCLAVFAPQWLWPVIGGAAFLAVDRWWVSQLRRGAHAHTLEQHFNGR